ncbi:MAG: hypothetical protein GEU97_21510 [Actinophytocola sp.]|nr:hypothetical protein [Actinophytocola sp.]
MEFRTKLRGIGRSRVTAAIAGGAMALMVGGGTAVAAGHISGDDIQHYSITKQHLKKESVGSWEAKDRSLTGGDLRFDSVGQRVFTPKLRELINQKGEEGPQGPEGPAGPAGPAGEDGEDGVSGYEVIANEVTWEADSTDNVTTAMCPGDKVAIGGGWDSDDAQEAVNLKGSGFTGVTEVGDGVWGATGWEVRGDGQASNHQLAAWVACVAAS